MQVIKSLIDVTNTDAAIAVPRVPSDLFGIHWRTMCDSKMPRQTRDLKVDLRRLESSGGVMVAIDEREQMERINNRVGETTTGIRLMESVGTNQNCKI